MGHMYAVSHVLAEKWENMSVIGEAVVLRRIQSGVQLAAKPLMLSVSRALNCTLVDFDFFVPSREQSNDVALKI